MIYGEMAQFKKTWRTTLSMRHFRRGSTQYTRKLRNTFLQQYIIALPKCALFDMRNYVKCKFYVIEGRSSEK